MFSDFAIIYQDCFAYSEFLPMPHELMISFILSGEKRAIVILIDTALNL